MQRLQPFLPIFKMLSFLEYQLFFGIFPLHRTTVMCQQSRFSHVLGNFIFQPNLSIMHGLQALHCGHFCQFSKCSQFSNISCLQSFLLHRRTVMCQQSRFTHVLGIFKFLAKLTITQRLQPLHTGRFHMFQAFLIFEHPKPALYQIQLYAVRLEPLFFVSNPVLINWLHDCTAHYCVQTSSMSPSCYQTIKVEKDKNKQ